MQEASFFVVQETGKRVWATNRRGLKLALATCQTYNSTELPNYTKKRDQLRNYGVQISSVDYGPINGTGTRQRLYRVRFS